MAVAMANDSRNCSSARSGIRLPRIEHPALRRATADSCQLALQGSHVGRDTKKSRVRRPSSVPAAIPVASWRSHQQCSNATTNSDDELYTVIELKLRTKWFFSLKNAFNAFDPQQRGAISREALYRILCNSLDGVTRKQYTGLLDRLQLGRKQQVTFWEFLSKFRMHPTLSHHWMDTLSRQGSRPLTARRVHSLLQERASKCKDRSSFLPQWRGAITKQKLSEALASISVSLSTQELDRLWAMYDPAGRGELSVAQFMMQVGMEVSGSEWTPSGSGETTSRPSTSTSAEHHTEPLAVVKPLMEKIAERASSLLHTLQLTDVTQSGLVTPQQLCSTLQSNGVPLTPEQCHHLLSILGLSPTAPVDYKSLLDKLMTTAKNSLTNSLFTSSNTRVHSPRKGRACASTADAETRLVCLLHSSFLKLLAELRSTDPAGKGLVTRERFLSILMPLLPSSALPALNRLADKIQVEQDMIPYPKFLAMFEHTTPQESNAPTTAVAPTVPDDSVDELISALSQLATDAPHQLQKVLEDQDVSNTGRLTPESFQQLIFRLGLPVSPGLAGKVWPLFHKNKDGTVEHSELIRHLGCHRSSPLDSTPRSRKANRGSMIGSEQLTAAVSKALNVLCLLVSLKSDPTHQLASQYVALQACLSQHDLHQSGYVPVSVFQRTLMQLCPVRLSQEWIHWITARYMDQLSGCVYYRGMLDQLQPTPPTYIVGNNLTRLLAQHPASPLPPLSCPNTLTTYPQHGIPGVKAEVQKQLLKQWRSFRRTLLHSDPSNTGRVSAVVFQAVLENHGVQLTRGQTHSLMESLDPHHSGIVNYTDFVNLLTD